MRKILFRCDGGSIPEFGTGHITRCLLIADKLKQTKEFQIAFLMKDYKEGLEKVLDSGYKVYKIPPEKKELEETINAIKDFSAEIVVVDRLDTEEGYMNKIKETGVILITLDDIGPGQKYADITINAIRQSGISLYEGPRYVVLPKINFREVKEMGNCKTIFLSFGGYDHLNLTLKTMKALEDLDGKLEVVVAIGYAYGYRNALDDFLKKTKRKFKVYFQPKNFGELLGQADLAVVSAGSTLFETMARDVPSITICQYAHQEETASRYERKGATTLLKKEEALEEKAISAKIKELIKNKDLRKSLVENGKLLIDDKGLERVFDLIRVVSILDWDTIFFGFKTARLHTLRLNENIVKYAFDYCKKEGVEVMYYISDCHHPPSVRLAEKYRFHFTDIRLTLGIDLEDYTPREIRSSCIIREFLPADVLALKKIAEKSYIDSRYYFDQNYSRQTCERFYANWIEKSCKGFADKVLIAQINGGVVGYITCDKERDTEIPGRGCGRITLMSVHESARGKDIGTALIYGALDWFCKEKMRQVIVVTQGRNYLAQRLYQKCGFKTVETQLWYHKWFKDITNFR